MREKNRGKSVRIEGGVRAARAGMGAVGMVGAVRMVGAVGTMGGVGMVGGMVIIKIINFSKGCSLISY